MAEIVGSPSATPDPSVARIVPGAAPSLTRQTPGPWVARAASVSVSVSVSVQRSAKEPARTGAPSSAGSTSEEMETSRNSSIASAATPGAMVRAAAVASVPRVASTASQWWTAISCTWCLMTKAASW